MKIICRSTGADSTSEPFRQYGLRSAQFAAEETPIRFKNSVVSASLSTHGTDGS